MGVKTYKRTSAGRRNSSVNTYEEVTHRLQNRPAKRLLEPLQKRGGRNHHGVITARHRGGGHKRMYRIIDFRRNLDNVPAKVLEIQYDPNRSCHIGLVEYQTGEKRYILAPLGLKAGDTIESGVKVEPQVGNCMPLASIPIGMDIHNIEMNPGQGGKLVRTAGGAARLMAREGNWAVLQLPSGEMRQVRVECRATIGQLGNLDHQNVRLGKAGRSRYMGWRPHVRGKAMNPVAHPLGGGEGRSNGGRHPCSPWGKLAKGGRTRSPRARSNRRILRRRITKSFGEAKLRRKW
ncbi:MAG: 50S ribosomal protein L2 [Phycisphaerae bacterium]|jgi:large subunit ribosomal protein L2|nr:50S ribosomal protein L2 [Phycisphaerae bacterium]HPC22075.1 50S ribosomal protein L2 [Phycisphaerae bacterium]HRS27090.1 50S ribosomal protein L2 [Phycisphaerae bacterium]HRT40699.1 50S ribosomal protein L2 [Phycisphaerae bacterium]